MSSEPLRDPVVLSWVDEVSAGWGAAGIDPGTRQRLRAELETDLVEALASGAAAADLTSVKPHEFAGQLAHAQGVTGPARGPIRARLEAAVGAPRSVTNASLVTTALGSGFLGGLFCIFFVYPWAYMDFLPDSAAGLTAHLVASAVTLAFAAAGATLMFRGDPALRSSVVSTVVGMAAGGAVAIAPTMTVAHAFGYSSAEPVLLLEIAMVVACLVAGILAARWFATIGPPRHRRSHHRLGRRPRTGGPSSRKKSL